MDVQESDTDWHFRLDVTKISTGRFANSSVSTYRGNKTRKNFASLDSEDVRGSAKGGSEEQFCVIHEFGHMIGLGDEYGAAGDISHRTLVKDALGKTIEKGDSDSVMSLANVVEQQHYVTFLEALKKVTKINEWKFK